MDNFLEHWLWSTIQGRVVVAVAGVLIIGALVRLSHRLVRSRIEEPDRRHQMRKLVTFVAYLVAIAFLLLTFRGDLGNVAVAVGIIGAAVAFALQEVILSVAGWLANVVGHFYKTGDRIKLAGILGDVIDMGVLRTTLMECGEWVDGDLYNGRIVRVANSFVFKEPVFNYSADFPFIWDEITVPVKYGCDQTLTREILRKVANEEVGDYTAFAQRAWKEMVRKYLIEDARVEPVVTMVANDNWMEFILRYVVDYKLRRTTKDRLFARIMEEFDSSGGRIAIASSTVAVADLPFVDVRLTDRTGQARVENHDP